MSVKVLCPKCHSAIYDPTDLAKVTCSSCSTTFDVDRQATVIQSPSPQAPASPNVPRRIGKYDVTGELSRGGMGIVYTGYQRELDRPVAIKVVAPQLLTHPEFVERFFREAKTLARLNHPHIVQVYDADRDGDTVFMVMELVVGRSLRAILKDRPSAWGLPESIRLIAQVCDALETAHAQGVVHRDIKPENLLVTTDQKNVKVADFGLAVLFTADPGTPRLTTADAILGTYDYMAPEQRRGSANVDHRADLYSLGVVMYELLTGRLPVGRVDPPSKVSGVPPYLDEVVFRALEQDPEKRWPQAKAMRTALEGPSPTPSPGGRPAPKTSPLQWVFAAVLCACTLVALWVTAARVKAQKMAARAGEPIESARPAQEPRRLRIAPDRHLSGTSARTLEEFFAGIPQGTTVDVEVDPTSPPQRQDEVVQEASRRGVDLRFVVGETGIARLVLHRNERLRVEHFILRFWERVDNLSVYDAQGRHLVEFLRMKKGQIRRWQELQLSFMEVEKDRYILEIEVKPGSASFGRGFYRALRPGLRVIFPHDQAMTVSAWDPGKPELKLKCESENESCERTLGPDSEGRVYSMYYQLKRDPEGEYRLLLDDLE